MPESYRQIPDRTFGVDWREDVPGTRVQRWQTQDDARRNREYGEMWSLYLGKHWSGDGGPWPHPYGLKGIDEKIPYQQMNLLGKSSRAFADMIFGDGLAVESSDERAEEIFSSIDYRKFWSALVMASVYGVCGIQPGRRRDGSWFFDVINPQYVYPEYHPTRCDEVVRVRKAIPFCGVQAGTKKIDILYEETHLRDRVETRIYQISGQSIVKQLPIEAYALVDPDATVFPVWNHGMGELWLTVMVNERIDRTTLSDYTISAIRSQQSLNEQKTQIARILKMHSNPKLLAPPGTFIKDPETGRYYWPYQDSEVLGVPDDAAGTYNYLTWDGQISAALENRDDLIYSICTELDMSPQMLSISRLVGGTSAETAAKLEKMLQSTIKRAERKREWAWIALDAVLKNILAASGIDAEFSIKFPELFPRSKEERLEEAAMRRREGLISTKDALMLVDGIEADEAESKALEILLESQNSIAKQYSSQLPSLLSEPQNPLGVVEPGNAAV